MVVLKAMDKSKHQRENIILVAQEISFAKNLAGNNVKLRDRALRKLRKWLHARSHPNEETLFTFEDLMRIWKGLFYCMWMSDKPLIQEELAESISSLVHSLDDHKVALLFFKTFLKTMRTEWSGIDSFRVGKFQMLVRRLLRQYLMRIAKDEWKGSPGLADAVWDELLSEQDGRPPPLGLSLHFCELFLEEIAKVSQGKDLGEEVIVTLLRPFARALANKKVDSPLRGTVSKAVFHYLMRQSDKGLEDQEKVDAWKQMGCLAVPLDQFEKVEIEDEEKEEDDQEDSDVQINAKPLLDPRAGQMDVELPQIPFNPQHISALLLNEALQPEVPRKLRRQVKSLAQKFEMLSAGKYPLEFQVPISEKDTMELGWCPRNAVMEAAHELLNFNEELKVKEIEEGVAKPNVMKRHMAENTNKEVKGPKRLKKRGRRAAKWSVTDVVAETNCSMDTSSNSTGHWDISIAEKEPEEKTESWDKPMEEGEYEFFVATKNTPTYSKKKTIKLDHNSSPKKELQQQAESIGTPSTGKRRVAIHLEKNRVQEVAEYAKQLQLSPGNPYDSSKRPRQSVLKSSPFPSTPVNPFYHNKMKRLLS